MEQTLRVGWTFTYTLKELLVAATAKVSHHGERLAHWQKELATREKTLISKGLKLTKHTKINMVSNYQTERASFDNDLYALFEEAQERVSRHQGLVEEFQRWERALTHDVARGSVLHTSRELTVDDIEHFGL